MTPKEQANQLIEKFKNKPIKPATIQLKRKPIEFRMNHQSAIQCALICVEEIMMMCPYNNLERGRAFPDTIEELRSPDWHFRSYWEEVKSELEKF